MVSTRRQAAVPTEDELSTITSKTTAKRATKPKTSAAKATSKSTKEKSTSKDTTSAVEESSEAASVMPTTKPRATRTTKTSKAPEPVPEPSVPSKPKRTTRAKPEPQLTETSKPSRSTRAKRVVAEESVQPPAVEPVPEAEPEQKPSKKRGARSHAEEEESKEDALATQPPARASRKRAVEIQAEEKPSRKRAAASQSEEKIVKKRTAAAIKKQETGKEAKPKADSKPSRAKRTKKEPEVVEEEPAELKTTRRSARSDSNAPKVASDAAEDKENSTPSDVPRQEAAEADSPPKPAKIQIDMASLRHPSPQKVKTPPKVAFSTATVSFNPAILPSASKLPLPAEKCAAVMESPAPKSSLFSASARKGPPGSSAKLFATSPAKRMNSGADEQGKAGSTLFSASPQKLVLEPSLLRSAVKNRAAGEGYKQSALTASARKIRLESPIFKFAAPSRDQCNSPARAFGASSLSMSPRRLKTPGRTPGTTSGSASGGFLNLSPTRSHPIFALIREQSAEPRMASPGNADVTLMFDEPKFPCIMEQPEEEATPKRPFEDDDVFGVQPSLSSAAPFAVPDATWTIATEEDNQDNESVSVSPPNNVFSASVTSITPPMLPLTDIIDYPDNSTIIGEELEDQITREILAATPKSNKVERVATPEVFMIQPQATAMPATPTPIKVQPLPTAMDTPIVAPQPIAPAKMSSPNKLEEAVSTAVEEPEVHTASNADAEAEPTTPPTQAVVSHREDPVTPAPAKVNPYSMAFTAPVPRHRAPSPMKSSLRSPEKRAMASARKTVTWKPVDSKQSPPKSRDGPFCGLVFFVDVHNADGSDAAKLFVPLLEELGGFCVPHWTSNTMAITHVIFMNGEMRTLEKVVASNGLVKCVNIGWAMDCDKTKTRIDESKYLIDLSRVPGNTPRALSNVSTASPRANITPTRGTSKSPFKAIMTPFVLKTSTDSPIIQENKENSPLSHSKLPPLPASPTTPGLLKNEELVQRTAPPKQAFKPLFGSIGSQGSFAKRLAGAKRRQSEHVLGRTPKKSRPELQDIFE